jgi:hypothetical protein
MIDNKGKNNPFYGKKHTQEVKDKISKANKDRKHTQETRDKMSKSRLGILNPNWKGDKVGYEGIHIRMNKILIKPKNCDICKSEKPLDMANISGNYLDDIKDWQWLCRKCHMESDNRIINNSIQSIKKYRENKVKGA